MGTVTVTASNEVISIPVDVTSLQRIPPQLTSQRSYHCVEGGEEGYASPNYAERCTLLVTIPSAEYKLSLHSVYRRAVNNCAWPDTDYTDAKAFVRRKIREGVGSNTLPIAIAEAILELAFEQALERISSKLARYYEADYSEAYPSCATWLYFSADTRLMLGSRDLLEACGFGGGDSEFKKFLRKYRLELAQ